MSDSIKRMLPKRPKSTASSFPLPAKWRRRLKRRSGGSEEGFVGTRGRPGTRKKLAELIVVDGWDFAKNTV